MNAGVYKGAETVQVNEENIPHLNDKEALVKVAYAGICGTDMMIYSGAHPRAAPPLIMGHEFSGYVKEVKGLDRIKPGDRVTINPLISCGKCYACSIGQNHICNNLKYLGIDRNGGFAEYVSVPANNLFLLDDSVSDEEGALTEPLAVAVHSIRKSSMRIGDVVVILGAGPIGMLIAMLANRAGASQVVISDVSPFRLQLAEKLGFYTVDASKTDIVHVAKDLTNGIGADAVFEVAGTQSTADQMIDAIKPQGEIMLVSVYKKPPQVKMAQMHFREISLKTTRCFSTYDFEQALYMLKNKEVDVSTLISHKLPIGKFDEGFQLMKDSNQSLKVLYQL
ncbi:zinc-dependent alcohol dehydrogenase [Alteribacillus bidgolensis]|uniref:2-desacetyl-2-hydroxyethyl bacteriochlorophyllide A dehydrogenase n=1 Tax=Alteribacillus bidgolensis TaxID=930129 RepID=A0A1G8PLY2_9BACI|nr:alcohol dehydrogenase catalytic domain-containing protein [Alteribacillus bidgolensis]SDI92850.1 2-desacetyl-2-hydroxyethyl bacteriochlorophyllide A dehydrogenase [Alteribacillus bidgolensis]